MFGWAGLEGDEPVELICAGPERELRSTFGLMMAVAFLVGTGRGMIRAWRLRHLNDMR